MKRFCFFLLFCFLCCLPSLGAELPHNKVQVGTCVIRGSVPKSIARKIAVNISANEFFTESAKVVEINVDTLGNLMGEFPMEMRYELGGVTVKIDNVEYQQMIVLSQDDTLQIVVSKDNAITIKGAVESDLVKNYLLFNYVLAVEDNNEEFKAIPSGLTAMQHQKNVLQQIPNRLSASGKSLLRGLNKSDKAFLENWGKINLLESQLLVPVHTQRDVAKKYFAFLKQVQWDNQLLYNNKGLAAIIVGLLRTPSLAIPAIHETPIEAWTEDVKKVFAEIPFVPNAFLCELLAFASYQEQIFSGKSLSEVQIKNIKSGFKTQNWASLLLNKKAQ